MDIIGSEYSWMAQVGSRLSKKNKNIKQPFCEVECIEIGIKDQSVQNMSSLRRDNAQLGG